MKKILLLTTIIVGLFLVACAAEPYVCSDGSVVADEGACPAPTVSTQETPSEPEVAIDDPAPGLVSDLNLPLSKTVADLKQKAAKVQGYSFTYAELPENRATRKYFIRGDFARVELYTGSTRSANSFDTVFLNIPQQKAVAYCVTGSSIVCPDKTKVIDRPEFSEYYFELPQQFIAAVTNGEDAGSITYDDQTAKIFTTVKDGQNMRVTAHSYYGIPMKIEIYGSEEYVGEAGGYQLRDVSINSVKEGDVTPPGGW